MKTPRHGRPLPGNRWDLLAGVEPAEPPSVSVVVAHYRQQRQLDRTLGALARQDHSGPLEIIVVDDGSPRAPDVPPGVRLVRQEDRGFRLAAARNAGAALATGDVLCFLDADTAPEPAYVRELTRLPALAPDVVTVGRRRHADLEAVAPDCAVEEAGPRRELDEPAWLREAYARSDDLLRADDRSFRYVIGAVTACSAHLFAETGGYDESFTRYGGEDWEWAYRAWLRGALFAHVPAAVAWHDGEEWAARTPIGRAVAKNEEVLALSSLIPLPGSGPRGGRGPYADIVVLGAGPVERPEWFVSVDSLAAELPLAAFAGDPRSLDRTRIEITLERPTRVRPGALGPILERFDREGLGDLTLEGDDGRPLLTLTATRARARQTRWGRDDLFPRHAERAAGVELVPPDPDVEAYLGGWS